MSVLSHLQPESVFRHFEELSALPHGSGNTGIISDHCVRFAEKLGLSVLQDKLGNVMIFKPAAPGYETAAPVIFQGHLDMVCEKEAACPLDMAREGLSLFTQGDLIGAKGTTLGGDDGIAVAFALALLEDPALLHPPLEIVLTVDEEIGMLGAAGMDFSPLKGRRMLNLDSEEEGVLLTGCAGGVTAHISLPLERLPCTGIRAELRIFSLTGGHSGVEIHRGGANACRLLGELLEELGAVTEFSLLSLQGGSKDNAIPHCALGELLLPPGAESAFTAWAEEQERRLKLRLKNTDPHLTLTARCTGHQNGNALSPECLQKVLRLINGAPNGVQKMSPSVPGLVQTSLNLGILNTGEDALSLHISLRSSVDQEKEALLAQLTAHAGALGGAVCAQGDYPGWTYREESPLRDTMTRLFSRMFGRPPEIRAIHAGVECGFFAQKLPGLDCVSYGPEITDIHTPKERLSISSVRRVWEYTLKILESLK